MAEDVNGEQPAENKGRNQGQEEVPHLEPFQKSVCDKNRQQQGEQDRGDRHQGHGAKGPDVNVLLVVSRNRRVERDITHGGKGWGIHPAARELCSCLPRGDMRRPAMRTVMVMGGTLEMGLPARM